jgi:hypothetical protein
MTETRYSITKHPRLITLCVFLLLLLLCCPVQSATVSPQVAVTVNPDLVVVKTIVTTTTTPAATCQAPCECMAQASAEAKWGANGYIQCSQTPCGRAPITTAVIPYYCFQPVTTQVVTCKEPCQCTDPETARLSGWTTYCGGKQQTCGYDRLKNPLYCFEPYVTCRQGCTCLSRDDGAAKGLSFCDGKMAVCGITAAGLPEYCYQTPSTISRVTVAETTSPLQVASVVPVSMVPVTPVGVVPVTVQTLVTAELAPYCLLSGELKNFDYDPGLVNVEIQEAVSLQKTCLSEPPYTCIGPMVIAKQGTEPSSASVSKAGSSLTYQAFVSCGGSFRISLKAEKVGPCTWEGTWTPAKSNYVVMNGTAKNGYDFTFVPANDAENAACALCNAPALPASFDWRNVAGHNWLTPVRDQASCGSCWAMATLGVTEAMYNIEHDAAMNLNLAEQNFISCTGGGGTCAGGWPFNAATYMKNTGVVTETCFPYVAWNAPCTYACASPATNRWKIAEHTPLSLEGHIPRDTNGWKRALLCKGPLAVCDHHHCVTLIGWNDATQKWTFKNSWGEDYGTNGYGTRLYTDDTWMLYAWWFGGVYQ